MNFALMQHHGYTMGDLNNMIPYEREVYVILLKQYLEEKKQKLQS
jgi:hypothetical protein